MTPPQHRRVQPGAKHVLKTFEELTDQQLEAALTTAAKCFETLRHTTLAEGTSVLIPFGGIKHSGYGRELSSLGIQEFVNKKLIRVADIHAPA